MAKLNSGILGGISGTVGNVVGGRWRGIDYIRSKPAKVRNPNTEGQQKQRMRFRLVIGLLKRISLLVKVGFSNRSGKQTPMNAAMSVNLKQAVKGEYPDFEIDPEKLIFSTGELSSGVNPEMDASQPGIVTISWENNSEAGNASNQDGAIALLYNTDRNEVVYKMSGVVREDESMELSIPQNWEGSNIAGYLAFRSETGDETSQNRFISIETAAETP